MRLCPPGTRIQSDAASDHVSPARDADAADGVGRACRGVTAGARCSGTILRGSRGAWGRGYGALRVCGTLSTALPLAHHYRTRSRLPDRTASLHLAPARTLPAFAR